MADAGAGAGWRRLAGADWHGWRWLAGAHADAATDADAGAGAVGDRMLRENDRHRRPAGTRPDERRRTRHHAWRPAGQPGRAPVRPGPRSRRRPTKNVRDERRIVLAGSPPMGLAKPPMGRRGVGEAKPPVGSAKPPLGSAEPPTGPVEARTRLAEPPTGACVVGSRSGGRSSHIGSAEPPRSRQGRSCADRYRASFAAEPEARRPPRALMGAPQGQGQKWAWRRSRSVP